MGKVRRIDSRLGPSANSISDPKCYIVAVAYFADKEGILPTTWPSGDYVVIRDRIRDIESMYIFPGVEAASFCGEGRAYPVSKAGS